MKKIASILLLLIFVTSANSQQVSGVVKSGKTNLKNVVVTDGTNFALTNEKGVFALDINNNADFVYVITPSGYTAPFESGTPVFYKKIDTKTKKYDFDLKKWGNTENYTLVAIADPQPKTEHFDRYKTEVFPDFKNTVNQYSANSNTTAAGIMLGDIVWDALNLFEPMKELNSTINAPIYPVIGNHDHNEKITGDDYASAANYREAFGPNYYGFNMGKDYVIVLDNIIYNTRRNYKEAITDEQLDWLEKYLTYVPKGSQLVIAMHSHFFAWWEKTNNLIGNGERLMEICKDYKVNVLTGHMHRNHNIEIKPNFFENNVAASNGSLWVGEHNDDGTPRGYKVFESDGKTFSWYYKPISKSRNHQMEIFNRGMSKYHPSKVVANIWDWDENWTVEMFEDGTPLKFEKVDDSSPAYFQELKKIEKQANRIYEREYRTHWYFAAEPHKDSKQIKIIAKDGWGRTYTDSLKLDYFVDVQAHRGGIGIMPENTIAAMINAVKLGVNTLELDLNISKDKKVVVSHDPWMNHKFVTLPNGTEIARADQTKHSLYSMTYDSIAKYETGLKPHPDYPQQKKISTNKPLVSELIDSVENFIANNKYSPILYNIEIKSSEKRDNIYSPPYEEFCDLVMEVLLSKNLGDRLIVQCFDPRSLNYVNKKYPNVKLSYLVEAKDKDYEANMAKLDFVPPYYSPHFSLVDENLIEKCRNFGMEIVAWTVDKAEDIERMINLRVDAIISNYPNIVLEKTRKY